MALLILGNGRAVVPKTAPWPTVGEKFIQEQTTTDDGASGLQNQRSSMLTEEATAVHGPIANAVEEKRQEIPSRLKRNVCVEKAFKYTEDGHVYVVFQCQSNCYPVYTKTQKGKAIVSQCVNKLGSG